MLLSILCDMSSLINVLTHKIIKLCEKGRNKLKIK